MILLFAALGCGVSAEPGVPAPEAVMEAPQKAAPVAATTVRAAYPPPEGAVRVDGGAFGAWLGALELAPPDQPIRTYQGAVVPIEGRVIRLPLVPGDLQQCADTAIRLRAEWQKSVGQTVSFHATSGDPLPWARYEAGEKPVEKGGRIVWQPGSDRSWDGYLAKVFTWAGTASLERLDTVAVSEPMPGDVVVQGGFPGHAVILLDVAKRGDQVFVLAGEGYMPAQDAHVVHGPHGGWWAWGPGIDLPHWPLAGKGLRRWKG